MKVFVTGYNGFIGRHLTPKLPSWTGFRGDILSRADLIKQMKGCNIVIHLAGEFDGPDINRIYMTNVVGTANVVQAMHINGIKRLVFTSSVGADARYVNSYLDSKFIAEKIVYDRSLETTVLRLSNLYGKDQKDRVIGLLLKGFAKGEVEIVGRGIQTRDFVYVEDVIHAILLSLKKHGFKRPFDIGSGKSYSILEAVRHISKLIDKKVKIKFVGSSELKGEIKFSKVNLFYANKYLGYDPKYKLDDGLREII